MKNTVKIAGIITAILLALVIAAGILVPVLFREAIREKVVKSMNQQVEAMITFDGYRLSLFRSFPDVRFTLDGFTVVNKGNLTETPWPQ